MTHMRARSLDQLLGAEAITAGYERIERSISVFQGANVLWRISEAH